MAINNVWNIGWYNQNSHRSYPISEDVSRIDTTSTFKLPIDFIVDLTWTYSGDRDPSLFHIYSLEITSSSIIVVLGYDNAEAGKAVINRSTFNTYDSFLISGTGDHYDSAGTITINSLDTVLNSGITSVIFSAPNTKLEAGTLRKLIRGVTSLSTGGTDTEISGDVLIEAGTNVRIDQEVVGDAVYLTVNALSAEGFLADCVDCGDTIKDKREILTINGIPPDENGNIDILGDPCMQITPLDHGLQFTDLCSQPCCGCNELEVVKNDFDLLRDAVGAINTISLNLAGELSAMSISLISSKTDDISTDVDTMINLMQALLDDALSKTDCNPPC